jgi:hypothetical protein
MSPSFFASAAFLLLLASGCVSNGTAGTPDNDGDGVSRDNDCDDYDPEIHPGAVEVCDGVDNDCNGTVDDGYPCLGNGYCSGDGRCVECLSDANCGSSQYCSAAGTCITVDAGLPGGADAGADAGLRLIGDAGSARASSTLRM